MNSNNVIFWLKTKHNKIPSTKKFNSEEKPKNHETSDNLRPWNPYDDTLSAAIMSGLEFLPINYKTSLLYFGFFNEQKLNHFLDLTCNKKPLVFKIDNSNEQDIPIHENVSIINEIFELEKLNFLEFNTLFFNDKNFPLEQIFNLSKKYLIKNGYLIIRRSKENKEDINESFKSLVKNFNILQEINIENFFKNEILIIAKLTKI